MNQTCKVCGEPAAGFHFGAFTCEGCKSFFGRSYNNLSSISECKNNGRCIIDKKNRTTCKACRLRKCYMVGMSKGGSRYGRRSNWFKIHCLLQEQQQQAIDAANKAAAVMGNSAANAPHGFGDMAAAAAAAAAAKQHMQSLNSHMLGAYNSSYHLPDMMPTATPFMSAATVRHPAEAAAAAALPFFSMMNSLPNTLAGTTQSNGFQLSPHLLFPSAAAAAYHSNNAAAAAAAADAAYRAEMYKHRQSVDSAATAESQRYSHASAELERINAAAVEADMQRCVSPELCVSGDDDGDDHVSVSAHSQHSNNCSPAPVATATHHIHNPIAIRATATATTTVTHSQASLSARMLMVPSAALTPNSVGSPERSNASASPSSSVSHAPIGVVAPTEARMVAPSTEPVALAFAAKMQSLSPVSLCSGSGLEISSAIHASTTTTSAQEHPTQHQHHQECPMDLSMKATSRVSVLCAGGDCDMQSEVSEEDALAAAEARRKFYHLTSEHSESETSSDSSAAVGAVKRQKIIDDGYNSSGYSSQSSSATSVRGIFVCV